MRYFGSLSSLFSPSFLKLNRSSYAVVGSSAVLLSSNCALLPVSQGSFTPSFPTRVRTGSGALRTGPCTLAWRNEAIVLFFSEEEDDLVSLRFHHLVRMIFCLLLLARQFSGRGCTLIPGYTGLQSRTRSKRQQPTCQSEHWAESVVFTPPSWTPNSRLQTQKLEPWNDAFITRGDFDEIHHLEGKEIFDLLYVYLFEKVLGRQG